MRRNTALAGSVLGAILALSFPVSAVAIPALDQYVEQVPGAGGDKPSKKGDSGSGSNAAPISTVSPTEIEALESSGEDGAAAAAAVTRSTPTSSNGGSGKGSNAALEEDGDTPLGAVFSAVGGGGSGGMGAGLPILLGLVVIGGLALLARSRRKGASGG